MPFGADIEKVKAAFGCKNETLFTEVQETHLFTYYDEELSFKRELYDIIFNYIPKIERVSTTSKFFGLIKGNDGRGLKGNWPDYGYALLCICDLMGKHLCTEYHSLFYNASWDKLNTLMANANSSFDLRRIIKSSYIFDTPFKKEEITCNYYDKNEVHALLKDILKIEFPAAKEGEEVLKLYIILKEGLEYCSKNNHDLIFFSIEAAD